MEALAKHDFQATAEDELSFKKGSVLKVNESQKAFHVGSSFLDIPTYLHCSTLVAFTTN